MKNNGAQFKGKLFFLIQSCAALEQTEYCEWMLHHCKCLSKVCYESLKAKNFVVSLVSLSMFITWKYSTHVYGMNIAQTQQKSFRHVALLTSPCLTYTSVLFAEAPLVSYNLKSVRSTLNLRIELKSHVFLSPDSQDE